MQVAIIGHGNIGSGIARNILKAGFELTIWNRTQSNLMDDATLLPRFATAFKMLHAEEV